LYEQDFLRVSLAIGCDVEAVAEVDTDQFRGSGVDYHAAHVPITEAQNVSGDAGHCQTCGVHSLSLQPNASLRTLTIIGRVK
jgi:hypothetical protein